MYEISLEQARYFRRCHPQKLHTLRNRCEHVRFRKGGVEDTSQQEMFVCQQCIRWWYIREPHPPPGNPALERFLHPCEHLFLRTLPGTLTKNECLECDQVLEKSSIATAWKNIRETAKTITSQFTETKPKSKSFKIVWDPEVYGKQCWGIEYH
jgi:hypothetical protein